jgi:hypothetical protein
MKINKMTSAQIEYFFDKMEERFKCKFVNLSTDRAKAVIKQVNAINPFARKLKLRPFCSYKLIVLNFEIGTPDRSPIEQILCAVHEIEHLVRIKGSSNLMGWYANYFSSSSFRALEECSSLEAENELYHWYTGHLMDLVLDKGGYLLTDDDLVMAEAGYKNHSQDIAFRIRGACFHESSREAIRILAHMGVIPV